MAPRNRTAAEIRPEVWLDARRALWLAAPRILVVADLHWGYAASHRSRGHLLPPWGDAEIAGRLGDLVSDYRPGEMIWLGDSIHALAGRAAAEDFVARAAVPLTVVVGNHDRRWKQAAVPSVVRGEYLLHHGHETAAAAPGQTEVVGHFHPAATLSDGAGGRLKVPALVAGPRRLILPAFSPWAAGTPWNRQLRPEERLWAVTPRRVFALPPPPPPPPAGRGRRRHA